MLKMMTTTLLASIWFCGCSTTATISRTNGTEIEAKILRSTSSAIIVETNVGTEMSISRLNISSVDHPGNAAAVVGGLLGAYGALNIAQGVSQCDKNGAAYCTGVFLPAAVGVPMFIWGLQTWLNSTDAAGTSSGSTTVPAAPQAAAFDFSPATRGAGASRHAHVQHGVAEKAPTP